MFTTLTPRTAVVLAALALAPAHAFAASSASVQAPRNFTVMKDQYGRITLRITNNEAARTVDQVVIFFNNNCPGLSNNNAFAGGMTAPPGWTFTVPGADNKAEFTSNAPANNIPAGQFLDFEIEMTGPAGAVILASAADVDDRFGNSDVRFDIGAKDALGCASGAAGTWKRHGLALTATASPPSTGIGGNVQMELRVENRTTGTATGITTAAGYPNSNPPGATFSAGPGPFNLPVNQNNTFSHTVTTLPVPSSVLRAKMRNAATTITSPEAVTPTVYVGNLTANVSLSPDSVVTGQTVTVEMVASNNTTSAMGNVRPVASPTSVGTATVTCPPTSTPASEISVAAGQKATFQWTCTVTGTANQTFAVDAQAIANGPYLSPIARSNTGRVVSFKTTPTPGALNSADTGAPGILFAVDNGSAGIFIDKRITFVYPGGWVVATAPAPAGWSVTITGGTTVQYDSITDTLDPGERLVFNHTYSTIPPNATENDAQHFIDVELRPQTGSGYQADTVLLVTRDRIVLTSVPAPATVSADGMSTIALTARYSPAPCAGLTIQFDATVGTLSSASAVTDGACDARVTLTAPASSTTLTGTVRARRFTTQDILATTFNAFVGPNLLYMGGTLFPTQPTPGSPAAFSVYVQNAGTADASLTTAGTFFSFTCLDDLAVPQAYQSNLVAPMTVTPGAVAQLSFSPVVVPACDSSPTQTVYPSFTFNPLRPIDDPLVFDGTPTFASVVNLAVEGQGDGARLTWDTELELDNIGFRILRADDAGEPEYLELWVPATGAMYGSYDAFDAGPLGDGLHAYWIEDVAANGTATRHGPVFLGEDGLAGPPSVAASLAAPDTSRTAASFDPALWNDPLDDGSVRVIARDADGITYEIVPPPYVHEEVPFPEKLHDRLRIPGWSILDDPGLPDLPVRRVAVPVPANLAARLTVLSVEETIVAGIEPTWDLGDLPAPDPSVAPAASSFTPRVGRARMAGTYPAAAVAVAALGRMGDRRISALVATPLRWDAVTGELYAATRVVARVSFVAAPPDDAPLADTEAERAQAALVASGALKVSAAGAGLVRVPLADLVAAGVSPDTAAVWRRGELVRSRLEGPELVFATEAFESPWSASQAYWIAEGPASALPLLGAAPIVGATADLAGRRAHFEGNTYFGPLSAQGDGADRWFWTRVYTGGPLLSTVSFAVPAVDPGSTASISLELKGLFDDPLADPEHVVRVRLNGADLGAASLSAFERRTFLFDVPAGVLVAGTNSLEIESESTALTSVALDSADLTWTALADAAGAGELAVVAAAPGPLTVSGLATPAAFALDETARALLAVASESDGAGGFRASVDATAGHAIRFVTASAPSPASWAPHAPRDVLDAPHGADYLVIAASSLVDAATGFADFRSTSAGGGFRSITVDAADLYDRFTFGDVDPAAIRLFLARARQSWPLPAIRYVLLVGDSDADPLDHLGLGVPAGLLLSERLDTQVLNVASDSRTAAFFGDDALPDVAIGRIPARDSADVEAALAKTIDHESAPRDGWDLRQALLSDDDLAQFDALRDDLAALSPLGMTASVASAAQLGDAGARGAWLDSLADGQALATYVGHGGVTTLGAEPYFSISDVPSLSSGRYPVVMAVDCMNGYFDHPFFDAVSEELVRRPGAGAAAFFGSSAVTKDTGHRELALAFHHAFWREPDLRLGDVVSNAYASVAGRSDAADLVGSFLLFGDPALRPNVDGTPVARAELVSVDDGVAFLSGAGSRDPEAAPLAFRWEIVEGAGAAFDDVSSATPVLSGAPGRYRVRLTVADAHRAGPPDELVVELRAASPGDPAERGAFGCSVSPRSLSPLGALLLMALAACIAGRRR